MARSTAKLWKSRALYQHIIDLAVKDLLSIDPIRKAATKDYDDYSEFIHLSEDDQYLWSEIHKLVAKVENRFDHLTPDERKHLMLKEFGFLHQCTLQAFGVVPLTIAFIPGHGLRPSYAEMMYTSPDNQRGSFIHWLQGNHPEFSGQLRDLIQAYCNYLWTNPHQSTSGDQENGNDGLEDEDDSTESESGDASRQENLPLEVGTIRDGIRIFPSLTPRWIEKANIKNSRIMYKALVIDRYVHAGYSVRGGMNWTRVNREYNTILNTAVVPTVTNDDQTVTPAPLKAPNSMVQNGLGAWLRFFRKHQDENDSSVSWEDGLLFVPTALTQAVAAFEDNTDDNDPVFNANSPYNANVVPNHPNPTTITDPTPKETSLSSMTVLSVPLLPPSPSPPPLPPTAPISTNVVAPTSPPPAPATTVSMNAESSTLTPPLPPIPDTPVTADDSSLPAMDPSTPQVVAKKQAGKKRVKKVAEASDRTLRRGKRKAEETGDEEEDTNAHSAEAPAKRRR